MIRARICSVLVEPEEDWLAHAVRVIEAYTSMLRRRRVHDTSTLGGRAKSARLLAGMHQRDLAKRVGLVQYDISAIERNARAIPVHKLRPLCMSLGITQDWLLGVSQEGGPKTDGGVLRSGLAPSAQHKLARDKRHRDAIEEAQRRNALRAQRTP